MYDIETASKNAGQQVTVFTCDQQLYRVTIDIIWDDPVRWKHFYPRIGHFNEFHGKSCLS